MGDGVYDEIIAATVPSDPDAEVSGRRQRDLAGAWRRLVAGVRPRLDVSTPEGRRLRRALDRAVVDAERLVSASDAVMVSMVKVREAAQAAKVRDDG